MPREDRVRQPQRTLNANAETRSIIVQAGSGDLLKCAGPKVLLLLDSLPGTAPSETAACTPTSDPLHCGGIAQVPCSWIPELP
jgi:hypothetical protein